MSDSIKHECGIVLLRLLQPLDYYIQKYGSAFWGYDKLYLLMQKQHNRGQDGAGIAAVKFDAKYGVQYIDRLRSNSPASIQDCFVPEYDKIQQIADKNPLLLQDVDWIKEHLKFSAELFLGHLRYGTFGKNDLNALHPFIIHNNWISRSIVVAGNFNLTNTNEIFNELVQLGQHPIETSDTITLLETIANYVNKENDELYEQFKQKGLSKFEISTQIQKNINLHKILENASSNWDGGYVLAGMLGHGDAFIVRDPHGIRPAFYYQNDEVIVFASERPAIQTAFNLQTEDINELPAGHAAIIKRDGHFSVKPCGKQAQPTPCSFERIYFSRGTDEDIYKEREQLGAFLLPSVLKAIDNDLINTVFSYIPNTALVAFNGMFDALRDHCNEVKKQKILKNIDSITPEFLDKILLIMPRFDQIAVKDMKLRTFITQDKQRDDLVTHVYDITYGTVNRNRDNLVVLDDSIVRGTTIRESIIRMLDRLCPKKIVIASSAPQIRYPDCYGIDMSRLGEFVAFQAAIALLKESGRNSVIENVYQKAKEQENAPKEQIINYVKEIYTPFTEEDIAQKIAQLVKPENIHADIEIVYNTVEDLHKACPKHCGDWYFTGNYPTPGGYRVLNQSFINYIENKEERPWERCK
ncbi:MAG: amidophosphoribosyltransferase [Bacteroidales bacterium]|jgi:amidophosphoribosyltransferase|nr:amidophosphoribosyltransferase [Bacteroidales bacterium]